MRLGFNIGNDEILNKGGNKRELELFGFQSGLSSVFLLLLFCFFLILLDFHFFSQRVCDKIFWNNHSINILVLLILIKFINSS